VGPRARDAHRDAGLGDVEAVPAGLVGLDRAHDAAGLLLLQREADLLGVGVHVPLPRELADDHARLVPDRGGIDVLVAALAAPHRRDVHAALVGERAPADVGL